jgi:spermidine synthase
MPVIVTESGGLRLLSFGTEWCQGAMRISDPGRLELAYAVRMFGWLLFHDLDDLPSRHLVTLGLGAGSLTRFARSVLGMRATAVEIDAEVIEACRMHFMLPQDSEGVRIVHADAAEFIAQEMGARDIDVLQVDAYDASVEKPALDSAAFYTQCRARLRDGGTVAVNLIGRDLDVRACVARLREGLQPRTVWQFPPTEAGNVVVIAHDGPEPGEDVLAARAALIEDRWDLPASTWLAMARRWQAA